MTNEESGKMDDAQPREESQKVDKGQLGSEELGNIGNVRPRVACILVNYRSPWEMLEQCLSSIFTDNSDTGCSVILVDNASGDGIIERVREEFPQVRVVEMGRNAGFAAAVNRGLVEASEPFVLMLNTDAVLTPGSLGIMEKALGDAGDEVAGVAPKMMSSSHEGIIDAVGTVMPRWGASYNRGIGQCDLGQYDSVDEVAGVCFGAALLRRRLFAPDAVGPLYEDYFLYFEDSDWCMRAVSQGYRFHTAPEAVILHMHSGVTRHESLNFKYRLIELNTLKLVTRNFENPVLAIRVITARCSRLIARTLVRRKFVSANISTLASFAGALPRLLRERRQLKRSRVAHDKDIFALAKGEAAYFDTVQYRPDHCLDSLIDTYLRLLIQKPDPAIGRILAALYHLRAEAASGRAFTGNLTAQFDGEPACVRELLKSSRPGVSPDST